MYDWPKLGILNRFGGPVRIIFGRELPRVRTRGVYCWGRYSSWLHRDIRNMKTYGEEMKEDDKAGLRPREFISASVRGSGNCFEDTTNGNKEFALIWASGGNRR